MKSLHRTVMKTVAKDTYLMKILSITKCCTSYVVIYHSHPKEKKLISVKNLYVNYMTKNIIHIEL